MKYTYFDNAALQQPKQEVIDEVMNTLTDNWGNASSIHSIGNSAIQIIKRVKENIANEINCDPDEIILCGSGSEANTLAVTGFCSANTDGYRYKRAICSDLDHASILRNPLTLSLIKCNKYGLFELGQFDKFYDELLSVQLANSEIGSIQDITAITEIAHKNKCVVFCDGVQAFGHIKIDVKKMGIDMLSATSQKIGGILGAAFLYVKQGINVDPIIYGTQNNGRRGSTYNTPALVGFAKAIELIDWNKQKEISNMRDYFIEQLLKIEGITLNGGLTHRLPNNINICINNLDIDNQQLLAILDMNSYECSAASACSSGEKVPSKTLKAIGLTDDEVFHSIRITLSEDNTYDEINNFINDLKLLLLQFRTK